MLDECQPLSHLTKGGPRGGGQMGSCVYLLQVMLHLWVLHLSDPAIVSELHSYDCHTIQLMDVVKLLVSPPLLRYQPLGTYSRQSQISTSGEITCGG